MSDRVVVFIDYQNVYRSARDVFYDHAVDPHWCGQVDPLALGKHLAADSRYDRHLAGVRLYRGMPSNARDPKGYRASRKQVSQWEQADLVTVTTRTLQYPEGWPQSHAHGERPREKGIDVALAIDMAVMASRKQFDVGILFSLDTDLKPSLEYVADQCRAWGKPRIEVAAWSSPDQVNGRLSISGRQIYCHWIERDVFDSVRDDTNYASP